MNASIFGGIIRALVAAIGGIFIAKGNLDPDAAETIAGGLATIGTVAWSVAEKKRR
jgi:hypothetical protein